MALDPGVRQFLDAMAAAGRPKLHELSPKDARAMMRELAEQCDDRSAVVAGAEAIQLDGVPARLYIPREAPDATLLWFHGGGFVIGDLDTHDGLCRRFCANGLRVISIDYRLAPEHRHPAAMEDALKATAAALAQFPGGKMAVGGDSAGGNLAAIVAQRDAANGRPRLRMQILFCPWLDLFADPATGSRKAYGRDHLLETEGLTWFRRHYLGDFADPKDVSISPFRTRSLDDMAPAYVLTAECDPLRDEGASYAERLKAADVPVAYVEAPGMIHNFYCMGKVIPAAGASIDAAAQAIHMIRS